MAIINPKINVLIVMNISVERAQILGSDIGVNLAADRGTLGPLLNPHSNLLFPWKKVRFIINLLKRPPYFQRQT